MVRREYTKRLPRYSHVQVRKSGTSVLPFRYDNWRLNRIVLDLISRNPITAKQRWWAEQTEAYRSLIISPIIVAKSAPRKIRAIHDIWRSGHGVVCLQVFNNAMAIDAFTREAAIIHAIGEMTNTPFENSPASDSALSFHGTGLKVSVLHQHKKPSFFALDNYFPCVEFDERQARRFLRDFPGVERRKTVCVWIQPALQSIFHFSPRGREPAIPRRSPNMNGCNKQFHTKRRQKKD